jgi:tetratricopeptide (TPR) repeat protein
MAGAGTQTPGDDFFARGQYAEAAAAFEKLSETEKTPAALGRLGVSYHLLSRFKEAETAYRQALRADSSNAVVRNNLAALFYSQRKFGDADGEFRRAAENDPDGALLHANLRASRYARDNSRAAVSRAGEMITQRLLEPLRGESLAVISLMPPLSRENAYRHELRGDSYLVRKMYEDAIVEYRRSLGFDRYNAMVANRLGIAYHHLRKFREAEQQYRDALRYRPNFLDAMINLGVVAYVRQDYQGALDWYRRALRARPDSVVLLANLGACLFSMERWEEGVQVYRRALELNPGLFEQRENGAGPTIQMSVRGTALMNLHFARIFAERGDVDVAISYLYKAIENGLDDAGMLRNDQTLKPLAGDERFQRMLTALESGKAGL